MKKLTDIFASPAMGIIRPVAAAGGLAFMTGAAVYSGRPAAAALSGGALALYTVLKSRR